MRGRVLLLLCVLYAVSYVDRTADSTAARVRADLHLNETQFGIAMAAYSLPYALSADVFGVSISDRFGPRRVLATLAVLGGFDDLDRAGRRRAARARRRPAAARPVRAALPDRDSGDSILAARRPARATAMVSSWRSAAQIAPRSRR